MKRLASAALALLGLYVLLAAGCRGEKRDAVVRLPSFFVTNEIAGGEFRQVIVVTNGLSLYFTPSNVCVWFCNDSSLVVTYDPQALNPMKTLLEVPPSMGEPGYVVYDSNADGVPELRRVRGHSETEVLYHGEWY